MFLRVPIKENAKPIAQFAPEYLLIQDFLSCIFLVIGHGSAIWQLIPLLLMKIFTLSVLFTKPFKDRTDQLLITTNEVFFFLIMICFLLLDTNVLNMSYKTLHKVLGLSIIVLFLGLMLFNNMVGMYTTYCEVKEKYCNKNKNKVDSKKKSALESQIEKRNLALKAKNK